MLLASYLIAAWWPLEFTLPRQVTNGLARGGAGAVILDGSSWAEGPSGWVAEAAVTGEFTVSLSVRTATAAQHGPRRIFTVSAGHTERNLTIGQEHDDLVVRLRRAGSTENGFPELIVPAVFARAGQWRSVAVAVHHGRVRVVVDGEEVLVEDLGRYRMDWWDRSMPVLLGNETTLDRGWEGSIREAVVEVPSGSVDYLRATLDVPDSRWVTPPMRLGRALRPTDIVLNVLGFVPLGFLMRRSGVAAAATVGLLVSLTMEGGQLFVLSRDPSVVDLVMNTAGAGLGALLLSLAPGRSHRRHHPLDVVVGHGAAAGQAQSPRERVL